MHDDLPEVEWVNPRGKLPFTTGVTMRPFDVVKDYPIVSAWWNAHNWSGVPANRLPALGAIAQMKGVDCAAAWIYMDNSGTGVAMVEWIVTNPESPPRSTVACIRAVVEWLMWRVSEPDLRFDFFLTTCRQPSLARVLEKCGFKISDANMIHLCSNN
jgi:hypothetical protein